MVFPEHLARRPVTPSKEYNFRRTLFICIRKVPASNLGPGTDYGEHWRESDQLKYLGVDERIVLKWILKRR
jgi:hypothetical protein